MKTFEEWYEENEADLEGLLYIAYMESGAYYDTDRESFDDKMLATLYADYVEASREMEIEDAMLNQGL